MSSTTSRNLRRAFGQTVHETRTAIGWSQAVLSQRARVSRSMVAGVELGKVNLTFDAAAGLCDALGLGVDLVFRPPHLAGPRLQRDAAHARCVAYVRRRLEAAGWLTATEVEIFHGRSHGWIDLLAFDPGTRRLLVIEVKTEIHDLGGIERTLGWYEREAWSIARRMGWSARTVTGWLLVLATEANDARLRENRDAFASGFPDRARSMLSSPVAARGLALIDPASRRQTWLIAARIDGRRSPAPYADYGDFLRRVRARAA